jgi:ComF family protein
MLAQSLRRWARELGSGPCVRCGTPSAESFCAACRGDFLRVTEPCRRCGLSLAGGSVHRQCPAHSRDWALDEIVAPFLYAPPLTRFLHALKYGRQRGLGLALGELLCRELGPSGSCCDAVVIMPLHPARLRQRSFNQADEIARPVARALGKPLLITGVHRRINTPAQTSLDKHARLASPESAFSVRRTLTGLELAIIDDVVTTGATINALARALRQAGARRVVGWAVARSLGNEAPPASVTRVARPRTRS